MEFYPDGPASVPAGLSEPPAGYRRRAGLAMAGLLGFMTLYVGLTSWFAYKAYWLLTSAWASASFWSSLSSGVAGIVAAFFTVFLGKALFFIRHHDDKGHLEITPAEEPTLFAFVHRLADEAGAPRPRRVFLSARVDAAVFYDLSVLNLVIPSRKSLEIGIGLVNALTLAEFKAVLAHEFGHFAQRTMAVGRWVYVGQQITAHIVGKRDVLDGLLLGISYTDPRIAWIGWGLRLVVWSIRAITDSFFRVVVLAERALAREMELQADRVAVSLTGSDALVHALYKLSAADNAWQHAESVAFRALETGKRVPDVFALHTAILGHLRRIIGADIYADVPPLPAEGRDAHRVFTPELAQPPVMWATHPANHVREQNAKTPYIEAPADDRPAWSVFADPTSLRARMTTHLLELAGKPAEAELLSDAEALACARERFDEAFLDPRYHGLYLARGVTRGCQSSAGLYAEAIAEPAAIRAALQDSYPSAVGDAVRRARKLDEERVQLEALADGIADAPGGVIQHRGQVLRRRQLPDALAAIERELGLARSELVERDRRVRSAHLSAALTLGRGWPEYHRGLLDLLHFAEHTEADIEDAMGHLSNVTAVVTADGRVDSNKIRRLVVSGSDLQIALARIWSSRNDVVLTPEVASKLNVQTWAEALGQTFEFPLPSTQNIGKWMEVVQYWYVVYESVLSALRVATLEALLNSEAHVAHCFLEASDCGDAPPPARVPSTYTTLLPGRERKRQKRLGWWDRFILADGVGPGLARFTVAGAVFAAFIGLGTSITSSITLVIHNGLGIPVVVSLGGTQVEVDPWGRAELEYEVEGASRVEAHTSDGRLIESFEAEVGNGRDDYVYSVAGAAPIVRWTAVYGRAHEPEPVPMGALRWFPASTDYVFEDPPEQMSTRGGGTSRSVLTAIDVQEPEGIIPALASVDDERERDRMVLAHARWEPMPAAAAWLVFAAGRDGVADVLRDRLAEEPDDVSLGRLEQNLAEGDAKAAVCERHRSRAERTGAAGARYLAIRCMPDGKERDDAMLAAHDANPDDPWLSLGVGHVYFGRDRVDEAIAEIDHARQSLRGGAGDLALLEARMRRFAAPTGAVVELEDLVQASPELRWLVGLEQGSSEGADADAYVALARGELETALASPRTNDERARVLRLVAASIDAPESLQTSALQLTAEVGLDSDSVFAALGLARRLGKDERAYASFVREWFGHRAEPLLAFGDRDALLADLEGASARLAQLDPELRGHASVLGVLTLGADAPPTWSDDARRLLFASERPWLGPAVPRDEP